ncbi:hypothetical protein C1I98_28400 [Spongiactinospora gelatinilytica]|uniref:HU family DNA-binding protein n=1 Tax=Spongiactinospora gelatinilytica TaxID=2666298 RepID=A0A2W2FUQ1_9ACTN|nr:hypothetical protein C1I98_28400 [Spongiactinospora gelatinilytica]
MGRSLNRRGLAQAVAAATGHGSGEVDAILRAAMLEIRNTVAGGGRVTFADFGAWKLTHRKATIRRKPGTGEPLPKPAHWVPAWTPGKGFKEDVEAVSPLASSRPSVWHGLVRARATPRPSAPQSIVFEGLSSHICWPFGVIVIPNRSYPGLPRATQRR